VKFANFNPPHLHLAPLLGVTLFEFYQDFQYWKTRDPVALFYVILCLAVSVEYRLVTDRHMSGVYCTSMALSGKNFYSSYSQLEYRPMPNVMVAVPNTGGALCSTLQSLAVAHCWSTVQ